MKNIFIIALVFSLTACTSIMKVHIATDKRVNVSLLNTSSPIAVTLYLLSDDYAFKQASYQQLMSKKVDGILAYKTWIVAPNKKVTHRIELLPKTKEIGVVASYRELQGKHWRMVKRYGWIFNSIHIKVSVKGVK